MEVTRTVYREDHEMLRTTARRFFERECVPRQAQWDAAGEVDRETWRKAGREGLLCVTLPTEYGGGGGDFGHAAVVMEEMHRAGVSGAGFSRHSDIIAPYINRLGTDEQKRRWLPGACSGETDSLNMSAGGSFHGSSRMPPSKLMCSRLRSIEYGFLAVASTGILWAAQ